MTQSIGQHGAASSVKCQEKHAMSHRLSSSPTMLDSPEAVKEQILVNYDAFLFDMDGVLWRVDQPIPGGAEALKYLQSLGKRIFFVTNNSMLRPEAYAEKLRRLGLGSFESDTIFASSRAAAHCLGATGYTGKVYMIGPEALHKELLELDGIEVIDSSIHNGLIAAPRDFQNVEIDTKIGAVVMGFDLHLNYFKIAYAAALLNHNPKAHLIFTNADSQFPTDKWILPGNGAFVATLQTATQRKGIIAGKPGPVMIDEILSNFPFLCRDRLCMVGDNLTTDIPFGKFNGLGTVLVETGVHSRNNLPKGLDTDVFNVAPDFVLPSVAYLNGDLKHPA